MTLYIFIVTTSDKVSQIYRKISRVTGLRYNIAYIETYQLINRIERINPDIVHLHCLNCAYINPFILLKYLGKKGYPVLVTHHADVTITANCDYALDCNRWKTGCGKCKTTSGKIFTLRLLGTERESFMKVLFAAGGTGGHINPALAAAGMVRERHPEAQILFVGTAEKMEARLVPAAGYDLKRRYQRLSAEADA